MKKWLWIGAVLLVVALLGDKASAGTDIGMLQPVQMILVKRNGTDVVVQTDTLDQGVGKDFMTAVENMKASASGEIFLETADHLLLAPDCVDLIAPAAAVLRPSCTLCIVEGEPDMEKLPDFLKIHVPLITLMEYRAGEHQVQTLVAEEGKMTIVS